MEARRVKRFQIGDSISPSSFLPVKRKSKSVVVYKKVILFDVRVNCKQTGVSAFELLRFGSRSAFIVLAIA